MSHHCIIKSLHDNQIHVETFTDEYKYGHVDVGHGQSEGELVLVRDIEELTCPVIQHCREKGEENHGVPQFIIRHSQGGSSTQHPSALPLPSDGEAVMFIL